MRNGRKPKSIPRRQIMTKLSRDREERRGSGVEWWRGRGEEEEVECRGTGEEEERKWRREEWSGEEWSGMERRREGVERRGEESPVCAA